MSFKPNPALAGNPDSRGSTVYGNGRRPSRRDGYRIDPAELAEWTRANERARAAYRVSPNALITARLAR